MDLPFAKEALKNLFSKSSCDMYPVKESTAAPHYRGRIVFYPEKCVSCGMCERVCAGGAITTVVEKCEEGDRVTRTFNLGSCTFCSTCADFCSRHAIELTQDYHMIATKEEDLLVSGTFIKAARKPATPKPAAAAPAAPKAPACPAAPAAAAPAATAAEKAAESVKPEEPAKQTEPVKPAEAQQTAAEPVQPRDDGKPAHDPSRCVYCTLCAKKCPAGALEVDRAAKTWTLDEDKCLGCGTCADNCPKKCIIF